MNIHDIERIGILNLVKEWLNSGSDINKGIIMNVHLLLVYRGCHL
jgi:hypothetical protein